MPFEEMSTFAWGFDGDTEVIDPQLALVQVAIEVDNAKVQGQEVDLTAVADEHADPEVEEEEFEVGEDAEPLPLPAFFDSFRRRARINTYTLLGPELPLDDYPFFTRLPGVYPAVFGPNSVRARTLAGERPS